MTAPSQIKQGIADALADSGLFDSVLTPPDDRREGVIMREPCAAVYHTGTSETADNGISYPVQSYEVMMKFLKIGVNETSDDIELAMEAVRQLEPLSIKQGISTSTDSRTAMYKMELTFAGCRG